MAVCLSHCCQIFKDVCCQREIMALKVYCRSEANGCQEQMRLQQVPVRRFSWLRVSTSAGFHSSDPHLCAFLQDHLNVCPFFELPCPLGKCKERMMRKEIPDHLSLKCQYRESSCEFCRSKMALTELQVSHLSSAGAACCFCLNLQSLEEASAPVVLHISLC